VHIKGATITAHLIYLLHWLDVVPADEVYTAIDELQVRLLNTTDGGYSILDELGHQNGTWDEV
jgi:hypothetical protein